jgi:predicted cation transporter
MFCHVDVSFGVGGMFGFLIIAELPFVVVCVEHCLESFGVVVGFAGSTLIELNVSFGAWLRATLIVGLIHA